MRLLIFSLILIMLFSSISGFYIDPADKRSADLNRFIDEGDSRVLTPGSYSDNTTLNNLKTINSVPPTKNNIDLFSNSKYLSISRDYYNSKILFDLNLSDINAGTGSKIDTNWQTSFPLFDVNVQSIINNFTYGSSDFNSIYLNSTASDINYSFDGNLFTTWADIEYDSGTVPKNEYFLLDLNEDSLNYGFNIDGNTFFVEKGFYFVQIPSNFYLTNSAGDINYYAYSQTYDLEDIYFFQEDADVNAYAYCVSLHDPTCSLSGSFTLIQLPNISNLFTDLNKAIDAYGTLNNWNLDTNIWTEGIMNASNEFTIDVVSLGDFYGGMYDGNYLDIQKTDGQLAYFNTRLNATSGGMKGIDIRGTTTGAGSGALNLLYSRLYSGTTTSGIASAGYFGSNTRAGFNQGLEVSANGGGTTNYALKLYAGGASIRNESIEATCLLPSASSDIYATCEKMVSTASGTGSAIPKVSVLELNGNYNGSVDTIALDLYNINSGHASGQDIAGRYFSTGANYVNISGYFTAQNASEKNEAIYTVADLPSRSGQATQGVFLDTTTAGSESYEQHGLKSYLDGSYSGTQMTSAVFAQNLVGNANGLDVGVVGEGLDYSFYARWINKNSSGKIFADGNINTANSINIADDLNVGRNARIKTDLNVGRNAFVQADLNVMQDLNVKTNYWSNCYWTGFNDFNTQTLCANGFYQAGLEFDETVEHIKIYCCGI